MLSLLFAVSCVLPRSFLRPYTPFHIEHETVIRKQDVRSTPTPNSSHMSPSNLTTVAWYSSSNILSLASLSCTSNIFKAWVTWNLCISLVGEYHCSPLSWNLSCCEEHIKHLHQLDSYLSICFHHVDLHLLPVSNTGNNIIKYLIW